MATRETRRARGQRRADEVLRRLINELRVSRQIAGLSQRALAAEMGWSKSELARLGAFKYPSVSVVRMCELASALGFELSGSLHPLGDGVRDRGQSAAIDRLLGQLHRSYTHRREVPFPVLGDLRSWDLVLRLASYRIGVEVETRVRYVQELVRRIRQRERHGGVDQIVVVLADTVHNRALIGSLRAALGDQYSASPRAIMRAMCAGERLPRSGVILI
jgi:transcriptional regulator with XRE-family HTH domain